MNFLLLERQPAAAGTTMNNTRMGFGGAAQFVVQETLFKNKGVHYRRYFHIIKCHVWVSFGLVFFFRRCERLLLSKKYNIDIY